jgi:hypothetical protein
MSACGRKSFINQNDQTKHTVDIRESASVHISRQNLVAAESLTALALVGQHGLLSGTKPC